MQASPYCHDKWNTTRESRDGQNKELVSSQLHFIGVRMYYASLTSQVLE